MSVPKTSTQWVVNKIYTGTRGPEIMGKNKKGDFTRKINTISSYTVFAKRQK